MKQLKQEDLRLAFIHGFMEAKRTLDIPQRDLIDLSIVYTCGGEKPTNDFERLERLCQSHLEEKGEK